MPPPFPPPFPPPAVSPPPPSPPSPPAPPANPAFYSFYRCYLQVGGRKYVRMYTEDASWKLTTGIEGTCSLDEVDMFRCGAVGCNANCDDDHFSPTEATETPTYID